MSIFPRDAQRVLTHQQFGLKASFLTLPFLTPHNPYSHLFLRRKTRKLTSSLAHYCRKCLMKGIETSHEHSSFFQRIVSCPKSAFTVKMYSSFICCRFID